MKQQEATRVSIGDYNFYIRPFPALVAANMTGDLANMAMPLLASLAPIIGDQLKDEEEGKSVLDTDVAPAISGAFSSLTGDKLEKLMRKLLIKQRNIAYAGMDDEKPKPLEENDLNEVFCGDVQDMFILAYHVIKLNYAGFFEKIASRFGSLSGLVERLERMTSGNTAASTSDDSQSLS